MRKITLVLLFCICAVGFSQAQIGPENSGTATSNDSESVFRAITAPPTVHSKASNTVTLTGKSSTLERSILAPKKSRIVEVKSERIAGPQNYSSEYGARVSENRGQQSPMFRLNANSEYIARTSAGDYTAPTSNSRMANLLAEGFDDITTLAGAGYTFVNASDAIGTTDWFQGNTLVFDSQAGAPDSYIGANFNSTAGSIINNWMITPVLNLENGDEITFWTRTVTASIFPDRLEVRLSPDGSATAPASPTGVGSYTELLLEINPTLTAGGYPEVWTEFTAVVSGLTGAVNTSVAFRYFVTDAGPVGNNSNYIGIDSLSIDESTGGGALMLPLTFEGQMVPFSDFNGSATQVIANPDASGVNTSANVAENVVPANAAFAGVNIVVPVDLTDDKMFSMDVWSPLAGTPVLLKIEGGANPPVERLANLTTTGAWEEIIFDFSSEGAITFDSVTIFMNFNMTDPANQTFYWDNLEQLSGGGGGPVACSQANPLSAVAGGGLGSSVNSDFKSASDIVVAMGEDFTIDTIDTYFLTFAPADPPTTATVMYYEDAGGLPGAMIGSETVVPTVLSSQPWANPIADQYEMTMSVTPFTFPGDAGSDTTYWIEVSMGTATSQPTVFWEYTNDTPVVGNPAAQFDATAGTWSVPDPTQETVYSYEGECTPMGGGGMACNQDNPLSAVAGGGLGSSVNSDFKSASDIVVVAGEDFTIDTIDTYFLTFAPADPPTTANVAYYEDAGGLPGALIGSETVVPTVLSSQPWANPIADQYEMTMSVTPFTFPGDAGSDTTYWIEVSMGTATSQPTVFWEYTNDTPVVGNPAAQFDGTAGTWSVPDPTQETVYNYSGECTPISVMVLNFPITHESQPIPFSDFNGSATQQIANPDASGVNTSATVAENVVPANAAFAGVNFVIDVDLTVNKFFAMDVWSPLAGTPVLLKLEGGPNPPVERQVNLTTSGAWEEVIFDFSSEGAITFESVTLFMNFNMTDPANQTFYWDNLERLNALPGPANDLCANAIPMSCGDIVSGTTINATEDSAVAPTCDTTVTSPGVWYVYEDTTGLITDITITMCNGTTDYDSKLSVYTGGCGNLICEVGNDDTCGLQSEVSFQSDGFTTFYILVHGFGGQTGNFEIEMNCTPIPPPNDMIANSIDVDEIGFPYTDPSVAMPAATFEAGSPADCDNAGARGVWYNFVPEGDGTATATISTPGGGLFFTVNNGPLAGSYNAIAAAFGGEFTATVITEDSVVILDDDTTGDPNDACDPILNGADLSGKIAVTRRGSCAFTDKVIAAQNAGAIAVIVVNNQPGGPIVMGGANPDITIPALMLGDVDGEAIIAELSGASVNVSMGLAPAGFSAVTFYTAPNENAVETDLVLVDWFENQCLPGSTASIPTVAGQAYYVYVANHSAITDIVIDGTNLGTVDNTIEGFVYYPNPTESILTLSAQDTIESVAIYNMLGQKVVDQNVNAIRSEINVSELATGAYLMRVSVNGQIGTYKILKK
jgi:uncharacterized cupin superfamily protein